MPMRERIQYFDKKGTPYPHSPDPPLLLYCIYIKQILLFCTDLIHGQRRASLRANEQLNYTVKMTSLGLHLQTTIHRQVEDMVK